MRIRMGFAALCATCVAACGVAGSAFAQNAVATRAIGGQGGGAQSLTCGGSLLGGAGIRQGALLDRIWPLCVPMDGNGTWVGAPIAPPGVAMGGMGGGGPYNLVCPPNFYVHSINVRVDRRAASGGAVRTLTLYCKDSSAQQARVVEAPRNAGYDDTGEGVACPQGFFANGINGASGQLVDRLGLLCVPSPSKAAAAPNSRIARLKSATSDRSSGVPLTSRVAANAEATIGAFTRESASLVTPGFDRMQKARDAVAAANAPPTATSRVSPATWTTFRAQYLSQIRCSPCGIDFGPTLIGQGQTALVHLTPPADGDLTVTVSDANLFVSDLSGLAGTVSLTSKMGPVSGDSVSQIVKVTPAYTGRSTGRTASIKVAAAQDVLLKVQFLPQNARVPGPGAYQQQIALRHTNGQTLTIPVTAQLTGYLEGIDIDIQHHGYAVAGRDFEVPFEWRNGGAPGSATLEVGTLPAGITTATPTQTVSLGAGERRSGKLIFNVSVALLPPTGGPAQLQVIPVRITNGRTSFSYPLNVLPLRPWLVQAMGARATFDDGEELYVRASLQIRSDGWYQFEGHISGPRVCRGPGSRPDVYRYAVTMTLPGILSHTVKGSFGGGEAFAISTCEDRWMESGDSLPLSAGFERAASVLRKANPSISVTRSTF